ncbi:MAG: CHAD domain-containing protein [Microcoleaceae cyanobacterium]
MTQQMIQKAETLGDWAVIGIKSHLEKILKHEPEVLKDKDPEELHQMRVGMRRLRSAITGFSPVLNLPKSIADKRIGKVGRRLGKLRDLDVLLAVLREKYYPLLPLQEQEQLDKILLRLSRRRQKAFKLVQNTLEEGNTYTELKLDLRHWLNAPQYTRIEQLPIGEVLPDLLLPQISELFLHPGWQVGIPECHSEVNGSEETLTSTPEPTPEIVEDLLQTEGDLLHDLRKEVKRMRYQMSLFTTFYGEEYNVYLQDVKAIQECLGDIQDSQVLEAVMQDILKTDLRSALPNLARLLARSRYDVWQKWTTLQQRYLDPEVRQAFRLAVLQPTV